MDPGALPRKRVLVNLVSHAPRSSVRSFLTTICDYACKIMFHFANSFASNLIPNPNWSAPSMNGLFNDVQYKFQLVTLFRLGWSHVQSSTSYLKLFCNDVLLVVLNWCASSIVASSALIHTCQLLLFFFSFAVLQKRKQQLEERKIIM